MVIVTNDVAMTLIRLSMGTLCLDNNCVGPALLNTLSMTSSNYISMKNFKLKSLSQKVCSLAICESSALAQKLIK
jgi:hypothetical protein